MSKKVRDEALARIFGTDDIDEILAKKAAQDGALERALQPRIHQVSLSPEECKRLCAGAKVKYRGKETIGDVEYAGYENRVFEYTLTDETVDRYGDVIIAKGGNLANYKRNPVVLAFHDGRKLPVGTCLKVWYSDEENAVKGWVMFLDDRVDRTGMSDTVYRYAAGGYMKTGSIGFLPDRMTENAYYRPNEDERKARKMPAYGMVYAKWELLEFSVTPLPANPSASQKDLEDAQHRGLYTPEALEEAVQKGLLEGEAIEQIRAILGERSVTDGDDDILDAIARELGADTEPEPPVEPTEPEPKAAPASGGFTVADIRELREMFAADGAADRELLTTLATKMNLLCDKLDTLATVTERALVTLRQVQSLRGADMDEDGTDTEDDELYDALRQLADE